MSKKTNLDKYLISIPKKKVSLIMLGKLNYEGSKIIDLKHCSKYIVFGIK